MPASNLSWFLRFCVDIAGRYCDELELKTLLVVFFPILYKKYPKENRHEEWRFSETFGWTNSFWFSGSPCRWSWTWLGGGAADAEVLDPCSHTSGNWESSKDLQRMRMLSSVLRKQPSREEPMKKIRGICRSISKLVGSSVRFTICRGLATAQRPDHQCTSLAEKWNSNTFEHAGLQETCPKEQTMTFDEAFPAFFVT